MDMNAGASNMFLPKESAGFKNGERVDMKCAVENVFWKKGTAPPGQYKIVVHNYGYGKSDQGGTASGDPISFTVRVLVNDKENSMNETVPAFVHLVTMHCLLWN